MYSMATMPNPSTSYADPYETAQPPDIALYEHAAGLLAVAGALHAASHEPGASAALSPTLACLEASLEALAGAAEQLGIHAAEQVSDGGASPVDATVARADVRQRFRRVVDALQSARVQTAHAHSAVRPVRPRRPTAWDDV
jgi:hypothetical protein